MRGPYLFPALQNQVVTALRVCDPAVTSSAKPMHFGAIALQCERHALLCYSPERYLLYPYGSTFGLFNGAQAILPFRASLCEVGDLKDWLPITSGAHWSHHLDQELPMRRDALTEAPQLVRDDEKLSWQLELRFSATRRFRLCRSYKHHRLQFVPVEVGPAN